MNRRKCVARAVMHGEICLCTGFAFVDQSLWGCIIMAGSLGWFGWLALLEFSFHVVIWIILCC
jgi:hypothetical protein